MTFSSSIQNPYKYKPKAIIAPVSPSSTAPMTFSSTQEAIHSIENDLKEFRSHPLSGRHHSIQMIGAGVSELKQEVLYLRTQLERSRHNEDFLRSKLAYHEQREEQELISLSMQNDHQSDLFKRKRKYSTYAPANFSPNFDRCYK